MSIGGAALWGVLTLTVWIVACPGPEAPPAEPGAVRESTPAAVEGSTPAEGETPDEGEAITRTTESGPVSATVTVSPAEPRLGDPIVLTLAVEAAAGVDVEMPAFGEALGRFRIVDFAPHAAPLPDGGTQTSQRYTLQPPMSGRQRIPPLRVSFVDNRPGQDGNDGGEDDGHEPRELLTDEIALQVASVLPEDADLDSLRPALGSLEPRVVVAEKSRSWIWLAMVPGALGVLIAVILLARRAIAIRRRRTAFDVAMARLDSLAQRGFPTPEEADLWYVELSDIVRRYIENRFGLRAPELTTEEFIRVARQSSELSREHKALLTRFLEQCDRVKFANYRPPEGESRAAMNDAREFVIDTRWVDEKEASKQPLAASA